MKLPSLRVLGSTGEPWDPESYMWYFNKVGKGRLPIINISGGNARKAARSLKAAGRDISESTLRRWKDIHAPLYAEIRAARTRGIIAAPHLRLLPGNRAAVHR